MNLLIDRLPESVEIDGVEYVVNADFRTILLAITALEDETLTVSERWQAALELIYDDVPENIEQAIKQACWFIAGGKYEEGTITEDRVFSFDKDAQYIYAAFQQTHGIDLNKSDLHWWIFLALFLDLSPDTFFCQLRDLRNRLNTGKATKEDLQAARKLKDIVYLEQRDLRTDEQREAERRFEELLNGAV